MIRILLLLLMPAAALADTQPKDGNWGGTTELVSQQGCPPPMVAQLQANTGSYSGHHIDFPEPFDPAALQTDQGFTWTKTGADAWEGTHAEIQKTQFGDFQVVMVTRINVVSPERIEQEAEVTMLVPPQMLALMGMKGPSCQSVTAVHHAWEGP